MKQKPILVTGMIRSGTTWVGKMLALDDEVNYIHEPFTYYAGYKDVRSPFFLDLYMWEGKKFEKDVYAYINNRIKFRPLNTLKEGLQSDNWRKFKHAIKSSLLTLNGKRPLIKEPTAVNSAFWFEQKFDAEVVIVIRHPAAVITSMMNKTWGFTPKPLLRQSELIEGDLLDFKKEILEFDADASDLIDQGILGWNLMCSRIAKYKEEHPNWIIVTHESISRNPVQEFERLFERLSLNFSNDVKKQIIEHTQSTEKSEFKRNSKENITAWKRTLNSEQISRIKRGTEKVWTNFYDDNDW